MEYKSRVLRYLDEKQRTKGQSSTLFIGLHLGPSGTSPQPPQPLQIEQGKAPPAPKQGFTVSNDDMRSGKRQLLTLQFKRTRDRGLGL